ncbi:MAG: CHAT domain-containing protein [Candidatus Kapabacteria bacterium]|nr:CHAT domain-containing protein [Candidatus Kapabacteria bacterium]
MKNAILILILLVGLIFNNSIFAQTFTLKQLVDSAKFYQEKKDYQPALNWALKAEEKAKIELGELDTNNIFILSVIYYSYYYLDKYDKVIEYCEKAKPILKQLKGEESQEYADLLNFLALAYYSLMRYSEAEELFQKVQPVYKKLLGEKHLDYAVLLGNIAKLYSAIGRYSDAEPLLKEGLQIYLDLFGENHPYYYTMMDQLGSLYKLMGKYQKAEQLFNKSMSIIKTNLGTNCLEYSTSLNNLAGLYRIMGKYSEAEKYYQESIKIKKEKLGETHLDYATSLNNLALLYRSMGRFYEAEKLYKESLNIKKSKLGEKHPDYLTSLDNLAVLYRAMGKYKEAEPLYLVSLKTRKEILGVKHPDYALSLNNLAVFYRIMGRFSEAEPLLIEAINIRKEVLGENHPDYAKTLNNLANLYISMGRYSDAEALHQKCLKITKEQLGEKHPDYAQTLNNLAYVYDLMYDYSKAEKLCLEATEIKKQLLGEKHPDYILSLNNLGLLYKKMGVYDKSESLFVLVKKIYKENYGENNSDYPTFVDNLGGLYRVMGRYSEAEPLFLESIKIRKELYGEYHPEYILSLNNLAGLYRILNRFSDAESLFVNVADLYKKMFSKQSIFLSETEKEKFWNTIKYKFQVFNSFSENRYIESPEISGNFYDNLLFTKGLLLSANMKVKNTIMNSGDVSLIEKYENWLWQKQNLAKFYSLTKDALEKKKINIDSLEQDLNNTEKELSKLSSDFAKMTERRGYKWQEIQKSLRKSEAAIELTRYQYHNGKRWTDTIHYAAVIVKPDSKFPEFVLIENGNDLEGKFINLYHKQIEKQKKPTYDPDMISSTLKELYTQYWQPISAKLDGISKVYISLDGVYNQFNLNTLVNPKTGKYNLEEMDIVQLTSTRELIDRQYLTTTQPSTKKTAVLFGDPKYDLGTDEYAQLAAAFNITSEYYDINRAMDGAEQSSIIPLPGTRVEVDKITNELTKSGWEVKKYLGKEALEEAVKTISSPTVLHIATHGKFLKDVETSREERMLGMETQRFTENPLLKSFLLFAGAENTIKGTRASNTDDGLLTAFEAQGLNLDNTELVVLSACETGLGEVKNGEGVYGLQRAFIQAGAKSLIMSLWTVNDQTTQELMIDFYRNWLSGKSKREAFNQAQQNLKRKYPGYYYWGAFVMVGE